jgi:quercetin dioxygenase-like cupin family protein
MDLGRAVEEIPAAEQRCRIFVRELAGKYSLMYQKFFDWPRVIKPDESANATQLFYYGLLAPGAMGGPHGHMNSAVFYILEGEGSDVHDGVKIPYRSGDIAIVEPNAYTSTSTRATRRSAGG